MKIIKTIGIYLSEIRIKSWLKNLFVISPAVFSLELFESGMILRAGILMVAFCLVSSAVYVLNDIIDVKSDRQHETKRLRPIAAGLISFSRAWILFGCLILGGLGLAAGSNISSFVYLLAYIIMNILYSKWLKKIVVLDCFCISLGFLLRVLVGGTIVSAGVSDWMFLTVLALSLFMAFGKRRGELSKHTGGDTRSVLVAYNMGFLNGAVFMCAGLTVVFYSLWSISQKSNMVYSVPFVLFIIIRYLLLVYEGREEADPTSLIFSDKTIMIACGICGLFVFAMLYL